MNDYVDVSEFVADYDRREACQAALRGDVVGEDDDIIGSGNDTEPDDE